MKMKETFRSDLVLKPRTDWSQLNAEVLRGFVGSFFLQQSLVFHRCGHFLISDKQESLSLPAENQLVYPGHRISPFPPPSLLLIMIILEKHSVKDFTQFKRRRITTHISRLFWNRTAFHTFPHTYHPNLYISK